MNKKLNLNKYAFLSSLKGETFTWLMCNDNFVSAASKDKSLQKIDPIRWKRYGLKEKIDRFENPGPMVAGIETSDWSKKWAESIYGQTHKIIDGTNWQFEESVEKTKKWLSSNMDLIIFEAGFTYNDFNIRTDILIKTKDKIKVLEVKAVTSPLEIHAWDIFFQKELISKTIDISNWDFKLLIIDSEYINNKEYTELEKASKVFIESPIYLKTKNKPSKSKSGISWTLRQQLVSMGLSTGVIDDGFKPSKKAFMLNGFQDEDWPLTIKHSFDETLNKIKEIQKLDSPPITKLDSNLSKYSDDDYFPWVLKLANANNEDSIFNLKIGTTFPVKKKIEFFNSGYKTIDSIPNEFLVSNVIRESESINNNTKVVIDRLKKEKTKSIKPYRGIVQKHIFVSQDEEFYNLEKLKKELIKYNNSPIYMYDFETADLAIPLVHGTHPYQQVPYQFSIHVILDPNDFDFKTMKNIKHYEWLAQDKDEFNMNFWKELAKIFLKHGEGKYVSWNMSFEKTRIKEMDITLLTQEEEEVLWKVHDETIDLMDPFSNYYYYHSNFKGKSSIKNVGPHFTGGDINYGSLELIQKGDQSSAMAKKWLISRKDEDWNSIRKHMLKYCEYDTLLMVAILQKLKERVNDLK